MPSERLQRRSLANTQYTRTLENRIFELEANAHEQVLNSLPHRSESIQSSTTAPVRQDETSSPIVRSTQPSESRFVPPAEMDIQTPMTIQASSPIFPNTPGIANQGSRTIFRSIFDGLQPIEQDANSKDLRFSDQKEQALIQTYLERVNPRYPFILEEQFLDWYSSWKNLRNNGGDIPAGEQWKSFFIQMAFAVSLLIAPQVFPEERRLSNNLYSIALASLSSVFERPDPVLHVQAYLMCTIHALHSPSSQTVLTMISTTMRCCVVSQLHRSMYEPSIRDSSTLLEVQIRRRVFWSAYSIDRLLSWIYHVPCSVIDENIQIELFANMNDGEIQRWEPQSRSQADVESLPRQTQVSSALHLIRVRRIQSHILAIMMRADYDANFALHYGWRLHMLKELDQWRNQLQPHSDPESRGYTSQGWVGMAYNYTILLLHRPTKQNAREIVGEKCLQACADILSVFRQYQKDRQTAQLWPGLLSQFGIGITLLYCFWATPPSSRTDIYRSSKSLAAIHTCSVILAVFAEQWRQAEPLRDLFDTLSEAIPYHPLISADNTETRISADAANSIRPIMPHIVSIVVNVDICRMITEMVTQDYPWHDQTYSEEFPSWSLEVHSSQTCFLCQDKPTSKSIFVPEAFGLYEPSVSNHDELFAFPGLFGSVEF
ncbi:hypothetical protein N7507_003753 [Penicillium longicatenatum]|nr:hypothetical protein N7507_003753 [Penicillium longicatenatum]